MLPDGLLAVLVKFIKLALALFKLFCSLLELCHFPFQLHSFEVKNALEVISNCFLELLMKVFVFTSSIPQFFADTICNEFVPVNRNKGLCSFATNVLEKQVVFTRQLPGHVP